MSPIISVVVLGVALSAFVRVGTFSLSYPTSTPDSTRVTIEINSPLFQEFNLARQGTDVYYWAENSSGFSCQVLFYELNEAEMSELIPPIREELQVEQRSPQLALQFFKRYSAMKKGLVQNDSDWTDSVKEVAFRQYDMVKSPTDNSYQKTMHAYAMPDAQLLVNLKISKLNCIPEDSLHMREFLNSLNFIVK